MLHRNLALASTRRAAALLFLSTFAVACSAPSEKEGERLGEADEASVCAGGSIVQGVDVSVYQGNIDWGSAKAAGIDFAIARISDGSYMDTTFDQNWSGMKSAGIIRGAYQFFEPGEDPTNQANIVIQKVGVLGEGDLPVTADMEVTGGQSAATIAANLKTWVAAVKQGTGKTPMVYTAPGWWDGDVNSSSFGGDPLWVANWGVSCPSVPNGWGSWVFWQYSDSGSVSGIPATVDRDEFNGDLAALQKFAGASSDWAAKYVKQSWPLATTTMTMTVNQVLPASITFTNTGKKTWDSNTRLGTTQPRDRKSAFAGSDWLSPNRAAAISGSVAPGDQGTFNFSWHAPNTPGMYDEYFDLVEESVAWFSDPGQGGPPDNDVEAKIQVVEADYHGEYVKQSYPTLQEAPLTIAPGTTVHGYMELKNVGNQTWKAGVTKLAPTPRDKPSVLAADDWLSPTRVSTLDADVPPGSVAHFELSIKAPSSGDITQTFSLVEESVTWFGDAPKGGGPPDDLLAIHVVVSDDASGTGGGASSVGGGSSAGGAGGGGSSDAKSSSGTGAGGSETKSTGAVIETTVGAGGDGDSSTGVTGGCAMSDGGDHDARGAFLFAIAALGVLRARNKRARG